jgi:hypothetical protein
MMARLRIALPIGIIVGLIGLFIARFLIPDSSALVLSIVLVACNMTAFGLSVYIQARKGLR